MALVKFKIYNDAALTSEFTGELTVDQAIDGSDGDLDFVKYVGSTVAGTLQTKVNWGVDQINFSIADSVVDPGNGPEASDFKLATTLSGLDTATAGASLDIGTAVSGGVGNAQPVYIRAATPTVPSEFDAVQITIATNNLREI